ncbi:hypothetical protein SAMN05192558_106105 [Actinokineospora alba]|uniref:Right handed beta helix domain-containing protein n=1 Tax=Actinokineospora alba TaxID=504798 RepID=A0A1H0PG75_9PSEU|nr:right-handed parallel beta-helix repeat-containing protein [Actinokineospora alba]TDP65784.1 hypothetical protein C8E96_1272 [Actinokineospora alba]SDI65216.1 hypothetical protein SAMN05421871_106347 [Actinokineospora alba]SDP04013.1 hypothetical protein SAMN05192558_106105 [Actinokineospora alba]
MHPRTATHRGSDLPGKARRRVLAVGGSLIVAAATIACAPADATLPVEPTVSSSSPPSSTSSPVPTSSASVAPSSSASKTATGTVAPKPSASTTATTTPGLSGWPNAANTGVKATDLRRVSGTQLVNATWLKDKGIPGAGTAANPYKIEKFLIDGMLHVNVGDSVHITVSQSRIYGGDHHAVWLENGTVTIQDSTIAPESGGLSGNGIFAYDRGTFVRNNIYGFNIHMIIQGQGPYLIQDNFLHDTYFRDGDHTDVINMNPNASNGVVRHNYIDGGRMDGGYTHNGIGIYNDATPGAGTAISKNWLIEGNYIRRSNHLIFAAASPPFVVKDNVLTEFKYAPFHNALSGTTDGGGNVDANGNPVPIRG